MRTIKEVKHIGGQDQSDNFEELLKEAIKELQEQDLEVEIQYSSVKAGNFGEKYNALLIGYQKHLMSM